MVHQLFGNVLPLYPDYMEEYKDLLLKRVALAPTNTAIHQIYDDILAVLEELAQGYNIVDPVENYEAQLPCPRSSNGVYEFSCTNRPSFAYYDTETLISTTFGFGFNAARVQT